MAMQVNKRHVRVGPSQTAGHTAILTGGRGLEPIQRADLGALGPTQAARSRSKNCGPFSRKIVKRRKLLVAGAVHHVAVFVKQRGQNLEHARAALPERDAAVELAN